MKINFSELVVTDIEGNPVPITNELGEDQGPVYKFILNKIYFMLKDLELRDELKKAFKGEEIELTKDHANALKAALNSEHVPLSPALVGDTLAFIDNHQK